MSFANKQTNEPSAHTCLGGDEIPSGTFRGDEIPAGTFR